MSATERGMRTSAVTRFAPGAEASETDDLVAREEPLEIRVAGEPLAVTMRTPGHDHELVAGFLLGEGLVDSLAELGAIAHCGRPGEEGYGNVIEVSAAPGVSIDVERSGFSRRGTLTTAACGVCGRRTIADLLARLEPLADSVRFDRDVLAHLTEALRAEQPNFEVTGGLHAAGIASREGSYAVVREDIGRHNAVDKAVGRLLLDGRIPARGSALVVSGRASFEIVQKAFMARLPIVVSVSAPSSLAIDTAHTVGITLLGFARSGGFNVYSGRERITD